MNELQIGDKVVVRPSKSYFTGRTGVLVAINHSASRFGYQVQVDEHKTRDGRPIPFAREELSLRESSVDNGASR